VRNVLPISITADTACEGETVSFSTGYTGAEYTHEWNGDPANNNETFTMNNVQLADAGMITVEVTSNLGCSGDTMVELFVNPIPTPQLEDDSLCEGESISLNTGVLGTHVWSNGGNTNPLNLNNVVLGDAGNYSVTVTDVNGCEAQTSMNLSVFANPTVSIIEPAAACEGSTVSLVTNLGAGYTLTWDNNVVGNSYDVTTDGQYTVEAVHDASGCSATASIEVDFLATPTVILPQDSTICDYNDLYIAPTNLTEADVALYSWNWSTGESTYGIVIDQAGEYILEVTNQVCTGRDTFNLGVSAPPVSMLMGDTVVCFDDIDSLTLDPGRVFTYLWDDGSTDQTLRVADRGVYSVVISNEYGCESQDQVEILNDCPSVIWIPNSFTPNDDGINEVLTIVGRGVEEVEMFIFNRWGEQIWEGNAVGDFWDGTYMNNPVQQDVYVYVLTYTYYDINGILNTKNKTGSIAVIR
jgi:gliding motility-associated-like protein